VPGLLTEFGVVVAHRSAERPRLFLSLLRKSYPAAEVLLLGGLLLGPLGELVLAAPSPLKGGHHFWILEGVIGGNCRTVVVRLRHMHGD
jgi:hypothetical protein